MNSNTGIYVLRENLIQFYKRQEFLLLSVFRFAVSLAVLLLLRGHLGIHGPAGAALNSTLLNVILALVCSLLPTGFSAGIIGLVLVWDLYRLSLEATAICAALILVCLLVYFRFSPRDTMILLLMPVAYALNLHYLVPLLAGLMFGPGAAVAVLFGLLFTKYVLLVEGSLPVLAAPAGGLALTGERLIAKHASGRPEVFFFSSARILNEGICINGFVKGTAGTARVESITAGGWNIQKLHIRTLVHQI